MDILDKINGFSAKYNMLPYGASVVCALSGGADSVCLMFCLKLLSVNSRFEVEALHINHSIRGEESDGDEEFCRRLCAQLDVPFTSVRVDAPAYAKEYSLSLEESARKLRYKCFHEHSQGKIIATAHNADDNLETALLNLSRGSGITGISGIPPVRDNIIRPLLTVTRAEIECFLKENNLSFVTDSTNLSDDYTRNKIRHSIVPLLAEINPSVVKSFINSSDALREENSFIADETLKALEKCRNGNTLLDINNLPELIRKRCIIRLLSDNNVSYSHDLVERAMSLAGTGGKINVAGELFIVSDKNSLKLEKISEKTAHSVVSAELPLNGTVTLLGKIVTAEIAEPSAPLSPDAFYLDLDSLKGNLILRNRVYGDKIQLAGRGFTSSVKKLINEKIPPELRETLLFIQDDIGTVWAERLGIAQRTAPRKDSYALLKITVNFA